MHHVRHRTHHLRARRPVAVAAVLALLAACGGSSATTVPPTTFAPFTPSSLVDIGAGAEVDLGMRSDTDGPSFGNYQPEDPFGADDAIALFGDEAVCERPQGDCVVRARAQAWIDKVARASQGGVCEGMALWSLDRYLADAEPATVTIPLDVDVNDRIVRLFATQFLPQVSEEAKANRGLAMRDLTTRLSQELADGSGVTLGIYSDLGGHTLVPYAVDDLGDDRAVVALYDPNWPTQERYLEVDLGADTWRYSFFSADQTNDTEAWFGTGAQIDFVSLERREAPFPEAFDGSGSGQVLLTITTTARNWAVRDGDRVLADPTSTPGDGVVDTLIRGAFGTTTVVVSLPVDDGRRVSVLAEAATSLTVESSVGTIQSVTTTASELTLVPGASPAVELTTGEGQLTASTDHGRLTLEVAEGASIRLATDNVEVRPAATSEVLEIDLSGQTRRDVAVIVPADGGAPVVEERPVPTLPAEVRSAAEEGLIASLQSVDAEPETTTAPSSTTSTESVPTTPPGTTGVTPATTSPPIVTTPPGTATPPTTTTPVPTTIDSPTTTTTVPRTTTTTVPRTTTTTVPRTTTTTTSPPFIPPFIPTPPDTTTTTTTTTVPMAPSEIDLGPAGSPSDTYMILLGSSVQIASSLVPALFARLEVDGVSGATPGSEDGSRVSFPFTPTFPTYRPGDTVWLRIVDQAGGGAPNTGYVRLLIEAGVITGARHPAPRRLFLGRR